MLWEKSPLLFESGVGVFQQLDYVEPSICTSTKLLRHVNCDHRLKADRDQNGKDEVAEMGGRWGEKRPQSMGVMVKEGKWPWWGDVKVRQKVCVSTYNAEKKKDEENDGSGGSEGKKYLW